ncbi:hypothetical protein [Mycobacterium sp. C31M]
MADQIEIVIAVGYHRKPMCTNPLRQSSIRQRGRRDAPGGDGDVARRERVAGGGVQKQGHGSTTTHGTTSITGSLRTAYVEAVDACALLMQV